MPPPRKRTAAAEEKPAENTTDEKPAADQPATAAEEKPAEQPADGGDAVVNGLVRIRVLQGVSGLDFSWAPGDTVELPADEAAKWADGFRAELAD